MYTVEHACPSTPLWWDPPWSPASSSGAPSTRRTWSCWSGARGGPSNDPRAGARLLWRKPGRVGAVQPGEEKAVGRPYCALPVSEGACRQDGENLFRRACCDRTRNSGFKLSECRFRLDIRNKFFAIRVLAQVAQRGGQCPIPGNIQGQVGRGSEQPDRVEDVPAHCGGVG